MKNLFFAVVAGSFIATSFVLVACSGGAPYSTNSTSNGKADGSAATSSDGTDPSDGTDDSSSGTTTTKCELASGTYQVTYTKTDGDENCTAPPAQTIKIEPHDAGSYDAGTDCKTTLDNASCSTTTECDYDQNGYTVTSTSTFSTKTLKGSQTSKMVSSDGTVTYDCSLDYAYKKK